MAKKSKQAEANLPAITPAEARAAVERLEHFGHDPMGELIRNVRGQGDCCYAPVEDACGLIRKLADSIKTTHPKYTEQLNAMADKIQKTLAGILPVTERNRINMFLTEYQHAALKSVEPPKEVSDTDVTGITVDWNTPDAS